jgi:hypothetical protein
VYLIKVLYTKFDEEPKTNHNIHQGPFKQEFGSGIFLDRFFTSLFWGVIV